MQPRARQAWQFLPKQLGVSPSPPQAERADIRSGYSAPEFITSFWYVSAPGTLAKEVSSPNDE